MVQSQQSQKSRADQAPKILPTSSVPLRPPQLIGTRITDRSQEMKSRESFVPRWCLPLARRCTTGTHPPTSAAQCAAHSPARCTPPPPPPQALKYLLYILLRLSAPQKASLHSGWKGRSLKYLVSSNPNPPGVHCALYSSAAPKMRNACLCLHISDMPYHRQFVFSRLCLHIHSFLL